MSDRIRQLIEQNLSAIPGTKKVSATKALIQCPFHDDNTPSGSINLDERAPAALGWFYCFGCKTSVGWNVLAKKLGLPLITGEMSRKTTTDDYVAPDKFQDELLPEDEYADTDWTVFPEMEYIRFVPFNQEKWRGFPVEFLERMGCRMAYHKRFKFHFVWMPIIIQGRIRGYVKARLEKVDGKPSYINAKAMNGNSYGLLFFDQAVKLMKRLKISTMVLCEGPRDALRLNKKGIPAMCVLGATNWSDEKRFQLEQLGLTRVIIFMDGDNAGREATELIYNNIKDYFDTKFMKLWKTEPGSDPGNCSIKQLLTVKKGLI